MTFNSLKVLSSCYDPEPGWILNYFTFTGWVYSIGLGITRVGLADLSRRLDFTCGDLVINSTLAAIWSMDDDQFKKNDEPIPRIYSVSSGTANPVTLGKSKVTRLNWEGFDCIILDEQIAGFEPTLKKLVRLAARLFINFFFF